MVEIVKRRNDKEQPEESLDTGDAYADDCALHYNRESERNTCYPFDVMHPLFATHTCKWCAVNCSFCCYVGENLQTYNIFFRK